MGFKDKVIEIYKSMIFARCDNAEGIFYFTKDDFDGLCAERFEIESKRGDTLRGYFYHYDIKFPDRVIVFDHGLGGGHTAYMKEIELLAYHGFLVVAYDHTGCMDSEGEGTNGLSQSLSDLDDVIAFLKTHPSTSDKKICVMGHSWGGFSTMNICAIHRDIHTVVSMSGFISVDKMLRQNFRGPLASVRKAINKLEREANPFFYTYNALDSLMATDIPVFLIYSDNDKMVQKRHSYDILKAQLAEKPNISFILESGKDHNPNFTPEAIAHKRKFFKDLKKMKRKGLLKTPESKARFINFYNWHAITEQDMNLWEKIFEHLEK